MCRPLPQPFAEILDRELGWTGGDLLIRLLMRTGMRTRELYNVTLKDLTEDSIHIRAAKGSRDRQDQPIKRSPSDPLPLALNRALRDLNASSAIISRDHKPTCLNTFTAAMRLHWAKRRFALFGEAGRSYGLHSLRAFGATYLIRKGVDAFTVQQWLGHRSIQSTMHYVEAVRSKDLAKLVF